MQYGERQDKTMSGLTSAQAEQVDYSQKAQSRNLESISAHKIKRGGDWCFRIAIRNRWNDFSINSIQHVRRWIPRRLILRYTVDWIKIDTSYRRAIQAFKRIVGTQKIWFW